jgi:hypothetical protein
MFRTASETLFIVSNDSQKPNFHLKYFMNILLYNEFVMKPELIKEQLLLICLYSLSCIDPHFLDLGTNWRWVVSFTPLPLYPRERAPDTHFIGGWVDPRAGLDDTEKWKFFTLPGLEIPPPLVVQPVGSRYTDWAIPVPHSPIRLHGVMLNKLSTGTTLPLPVLFLALLSPR